MEVMKVATDAILKVKDAELKAKEIIEKANQEITLLKEETREKIKKFTEGCHRNSHKRCRDT